MYGLQQGDEPRAVAVLIEAEEAADQRQRRSALRWILVLSPPRERPGASRPGPACRFLSFAAAPCEQICGQGVAGAGGLLVRAAHVESALTVQSSPSAPSQSARSRSRISYQVPSPDQLRCRLQTVFQFPNPSGGSRHGHPGPGREEDPVDHHPVIRPPAARPAADRRAGSLGNGASQHRAYRSTQHVGSLWRAACGVGNLSQYRHQPQRSFMTVMCTSNEVSDCGSIHDGGNDLSAVIPAGARTATTTSQAVPPPSPTHHPHVACPTSPAYTACRALEEGVDKVGGLCRSP